MITNGVLQGKRILFFSQFFFGYEGKITTKMRELGAEVSLYDEMSIKSSFERAFLKISPQIFTKKTELYYSNIMSKEKQYNYDYIVFIDCEMPTNNVLEECRKCFPKAKFCLHLWDSVENLKGVTDRFRFFDRITSFDRSDSMKYKLIFRPLFFSDEYRAGEENHTHTFNLAFVGTIHSDRYAIIKKIKHTTEKFYIYPYLQSRFVYYFYKIIKSEFRNTKISDFEFSKISSKTIADIVDKSVAVLDIQHPKQTGLTMRTLEMIGMKKKLITTNQDIENYDFYNTSNICIINRFEPVIPDDFYNTEYAELPQSTYEYYSIGQWIIDVLGV